MNTNENLIKIKSFSSKTKVQFIKNSKLLSKTIIKLNLMKCYLALFVISENSSKIVFLPFFVAL